MAETYQIEVEWKDDEDYEIIVELGMGEFTLEDLQDLLDDKEDYLGLPAANGYILSSTAAGVRSWVDPAAYGLQGESVTIAVEDWLTDGSGYIVTKAHGMNNPLLICTVFHFNDPDYVMINEACEVTTTIDEITIKTSFPVTGNVYALLLGASVDLPEDEEEAPPEE